VLADNEPMLVVAFPTQIRRNNPARSLASATIAHRVIVWTPQPSPLTALNDAIDWLDLAPLPARHA
jgi:hypothetical protein